MSMTREEAIERYEGIRYTVACFTGSKKDCDAVDMAFSALCPVSREQAEKVWRGEWKGVPKLGVYDMACSKCGYSPGIRFYSSEFCPNCGAPMTDEAVEIVIERLEALYGKAD